jgi:zinc transport system substrate-binding protein
MKGVAHAALYFAVGVEFEKVWLPKFRAFNPAMHIVRLDENVTKLPMEAHEHHAHEHAASHDDERVDPHIWTSPKNMRIFARRIAEALCKADAKHCDDFQARLKNVLADIDRVDRRIREALASVPPHGAFMAVHPSWGYFAHEYGLRQLTAEVEGKAPKPAELVKLISKAREAHVRTILTQPEFSDKSARILSQELGIPVLKVSPLDPKWGETLVRIAEAIAGKRR